MSNLSKKISGSHDDEESQSYIARSSSKLLPEPSSLSNEAAEASASELTNAVGEQEEDSSFSLFEGDRNEVDGHASEAKPLTNLLKETAELYEIAPKIILTSSDHSLADEGDRNDDKKEEPDQSSNDLLYQFNPVSEEWQDNFATRLLNVPIKQPLCKNSLQSTEPRKVQNIERDGNCLFRAISYIISGTEDYHQTLRQKTVDHMRSPKIKDLIDSIILHEYSSVDEYLEKMKKLGEWGTENEVYALANLLETDIYLYRTNASEWFRFGTTFFRPSAPTQEGIYLKHTGSDHFDVVLSVKTKASKEVQPRKLSDVKQSIQQKPCQNAVIPKQQCNKNASCVGNTKPIPNATPLKGQVTEEINTSSDNSPTESDDGKKNDDNKEEPDQSGWQTSKEQEKNEPPRGECTQKRDQQKKPNYQAISDEDPNIIKEIRAKSLDKKKLCVTDVENFKKLPKKKKEPFFGVILTNDAVNDLQIPSSALVFEASAQNKSREKEEFSIKAHALVILVYLGHEITLKLKGSELIRKISRDVKDFFLDPGKQFLTYLKKSRAIILDTENSRGLLTDSLKHPSKLEELNCFLLSIEGIKGGKGLCKISKKIDNRIVKLTCPSGSKNSNTADLYIKATAAYIRVNYCHIPIIVSGDKDLGLPLVKGVCEHYLTGAKEKVEKTWDEIELIVKKNSETNE